MFYCNHEAQKYKSHRGWAGSVPIAQKTAFQRLCKKEVRNYMIMPCVKLKSWDWPRSQVQLGKKQEQ